jgi:hypothetical protein
MLCESCGVWELWVSESCDTWDQGCIRAVVCDSWGVQELRRVRTVCVRTVVYESCAVLEVWFVRAWCENYGVCELWYVRAGCVRVVVSKRCGEWGCGVWEKGFMSPVVCRIYGLWELCVCVSCARAVVWGLWCVRDGVSDICGTWELWCVRVRVCLIFVVWLLWCVRPVMCESCGVWELWFVRAVVIETCGVLDPWCVRACVYETCDVGELLPAYAERPETLFSVGVCKVWMRLLDFDIL